MMNDTEEAAIRQMIALHLLHGTYSQEKAGHPPSFYRTRCTFLDCRGDLLIHPDTFWGWQVMVLTATHDISTGICTGPVRRPVHVNKHAWICSRALLYNCTIGEGAIVAAGAVVRSQDVAPWMMVAGNPARVIKHWNGEKWIID